MATEKTERQEINSKRTKRVVLVGLGGALVAGLDGLIIGAGIGFLLPIKARH